MQTFQCLTAVILFAVTSTPLSAASNARSGEFALIERGPHHKRWQRTITASNITGRITSRQISYIEMASGMHYLKEDKWQESRDEIELFQGGAIARQGQHQVIFAHNIASPGAIDLQMPDASRFRTHVLGLAIFDTATGKAELLSEVTDSIGEFHPPNVIVYPNCFSDIQGAIRYTYRRDMFEQDIILLERVQLPVGYNPASTKLEVWTEIIDSPPVLQTRQKLGNLEDESLAFASMTIGSGRAFTLEDPQGSQWSAPVSKTWVAAEGRTFLVEAAEFQMLEPALNLLPAPIQRAALKPPGPPQRMAINAVGQRVFPRPTHAGKASGKIQTASTAFPAVTTNAEVMNLAPTPATGASRQFANTHIAGKSRGLVLDYALLLTTNNFTFQGDTTYFLSGNCTISGTNLIEGGCVIKSTNGVTLTFTGPVECKTDMYKPAVFTSWSDNTIGEIIPGSTGNPFTNYAADVAIKVEYANSSLKHVRIAHASTAVRYAVAGGQAVSHSQFVHCRTGFDLYSTTLTNRNHLMVDVLTNIASQPSTYYSTHYGEHLTFCRAERNADQGAYSILTLVYTNCLLVGVTNFTPSAGYYYGHCCGNYSNSDPAVVFQTVGAGTAYLLNNTYRNAGVNEIDPTLRSELARRTTYPPVVIVGTGWQTNDLVLAPQAQRDHDSLDAGYHYDPIDYAISGIVLTNARMTVLPGSAIATFSTNYTAWGLVIGDYAEFVCHGSPTNLNRVVRYNTVQEQANTAWTNPASSVIVYAYSAAAPSPTSVASSFTEWSAFGYTMQHFYSWFNITGHAQFRDCQFFGGTFSSSRQTASISNCLFHRTATSFTDECGVYESGHSVRNSAFIGGFLETDYGSADIWTFRNNLFAGVAYLAWCVDPDADYNAYTTNGTRLNASATHDVLLATNDIAFQAGALGRYYLPTNGPATNLFNAGNTNAHLLALWHFTTTTNNLKETNSIVDIGFHLVGTDSNGLPIDTDGDGVPDFLEDLNGNGVLDHRETDRSSATDVGFRVQITNPRNSSNLP